jgi:transposase-like protein
VKKVSDTLTYYAYPTNHWRQLHTNNPRERITREIGFSLRCPEVVLRLTYACP